MITLIKNKEAKKAQEGRRSAWHPDFRDKTTLPDTKTVRTNFSVHILAFAATLSLAIYVGLREFNLSAANLDLASVEEQIATNNKLNDNALILFKKFQAEEAKFQEAYTLIKDPFVLTDFLITLGELMPAGACIKSLDFRGIGKIIVLSGTIQGLDTTAGDAAAALLAKLQQESRISPFFSTIVLSKLTRDTVAGNMVMEIIFTFKPNSKEPAKK